MRIFLVFAVLGLLVAEGFLLPRSVRDFRTMQMMRREAAPVQGLPLSLGRFAGYDSSGRPLALITDDTRWIVPIVLHSGRLSADLDYLARLRQALPNHAITLVGVCEDNQCGDFQKTGPALAAVPLLAYGSYAPLKEVARFDDQNQVLLLNQFWGVRKSLRLAASAEELAAQIRQVIGQ